MQKINSSPYLEFKILLDSQKKPTREGTRNQRFLNYQR